MRKPLDLMETSELTTLFLKHTERVISAIEKALPQINLLIDDVILTIKNKGRIFYIGAGTSGRICVLDASEIFPTFSEKDIFIPIMAGGNEAIFTPKENIEDQREEGIMELKKREITNNDIAIGVTASGKTTYVISALEYASQIGAKTYLISCNNVSYNFLKGIIFIDTGDEFIISSTRLNAGTAQKIVLNMISTISMIRLGRTYDNLMISVHPSNKKLMERSAQIVSLITGVSFDDAFSLLKEVKDPRITALMIKKKISKEEAERLLKKFDYNFRIAYES